MSDILDSDIHKIEKELEAYKASSILNDHARKLRKHLGELYIARGIDRLGELALKIIEKGLDKDTIPSYIPDYFKEL